MEAFAGVCDVDAGIGEEDFGGTVVEDGSQEIWVDEVLDALGGEEECGVVFAPGFEGFDHVGLDGWVLGEAPGFVEQEQREGAGVAVAADCGVGTVKDVEQQGLKNEWMILEALEIKALERAKCEGVVGGIEEGRVEFVSGPSMATSA